MLSSAPERVKLRETLLQQGFTISGWARKHDMDPNKVHQVITRYGSGAYSKPCSPEVWKIITRLNADTGINLIENESQGGTKC